MATITPTRVPTPLDGEIELYKWVLASGDVGAPVHLPLKADKCVHIFGTFGANVSLEGSNEDGTATSWVTLNDSRGAGNPITVSAAALLTVLENPYQIRPNAGAITSVTVILLVRGV